MLVSGEQVAVSGEGGGGGGESKDYPPPPPPPPPPPTKDDPRNVSREANPDLLESPIPQRQYHSET